MPIPIAAAIVAGAARALPMVAGAAGRAAAGGAARMGASAGTSQAAGRVAQGATIRGGMSGISRLQDYVESRNQNFVEGADPM